MMNELRLQNLLTKALEDIWYESQLVNKTLACARINEIAKKALKERSEILFGKAKV